ncbi:class II fructose-bisphosphatase [Vibrio salinus]|uniref:class II fructose-bisphosphatase n=1 Tax=Vibrio salinus TaxID=2899784 RepID=UPI001E5A5096|nr:class II fructose-bisphosphatase [Vibrio salinus]MCE0494894.1 class II fructose-bisphosphatase [Vibrio salinus]
MDEQLTYSFVKVTEAAAIASYDHLGQGHKNKADLAAVDAMRYELNQMNIDGRIVIGEGEIDEAPMLYIGELLGQGGTALDIAVDPIDGTRMVATGQDNAITVLAATPKDQMLAAPDMYMEKLVVSPQAKGVIDLERPLITNLRDIARALFKPINQLRIVTLAKPRHQKMINELRDHGVQIFEYPDGDVIASLQTCLPYGPFDVMYCIGGAPEGVISAAAVKALGGEMQGRLLLRSQVKGKNEQNLSHDSIELEQCKKYGAQLGKVYSMNELICSQDILFCATGITDGHINTGIKKTDRTISCESLLIDGCGNVRLIRNTKLLPPNANRSVKPVHLKSTA